MIPMRESAGAPCAAAGTYFVSRTGGAASPSPRGRGAVGDFHLAVFRLFRDYKTKEVLIITNVL